MSIQTINWPTITAFLLLLFVLTACQNVAKPTEHTPQPDMAEMILPDEHLILGVQGTPTFEATATIASPPTAVPTPTIPPLYQVQDGTLLVRDEATGSYAPDTTFPEELQGQAASVRHFASATGRYWVAYDSDSQAIAERFPDEDEGWTNLLAIVEEDPDFNPNWDRELTGFGERDLVIVAETSGVDNFEFLFVHSEWATQQAVVSDYHIVSVAQMNKALNYLRATAANQGLVAITENGLEIVPSKLPRGWRLQPDETGDLQLWDGAGQLIAGGEEPQDYLLFERVTIVVATARPAVVLPMYRNTEDGSETRHFLQRGQLLVHHYIPEKQLWERYIEGGSDWEVAALGFSHVGVLLANPRELLAHIQPFVLGQLNYPVLPEGTIRSDFYEWYVEGPQRFDYYLLGQDPQQFELLPRAFDQLIEAEAYFPLRFRLEFAEE